MTALFLSALWSRLRAIMALAARYPWQISCIVLLCASAWLWRGWGHETAGRRADITKFAAAQVEAEAIAQRALADTERRYRIKANDADHAYQAQLADARTATAEFIRTHRVRPVDPGAASQAPAPAARGSAAVPAPMPTGVVVDQVDVQACADLYVYSLAAHDWAAGLN